MKTPVCLGHDVVLNRPYKAAIRVVGRSVQDLCPLDDGSTTHPATAVPDPAITTLIEDEALKAGRKRFVICVGLDQPPEPAQKEAVRRSLSHYFACEADGERKEQRLSFRRAMAFGTTALLLFWVTNHARMRYSDVWNSVEEFVKLGLAVAVWVFLWQAFVALAVDWRVHRGKARRFKRIAQAPIKFGFYLPGREGHPKV